MPELTFTAGNFSESSEQLAIWLGNRPEKNIIQPDEFIGKGKIYIATLEDGLYIRGWNCVLREETSFHVSPAADNSPLMFTANFVFHPSPYSLHTDSKQSIEFNNSLQLLLTNSRHELYYTVFAGKLLKSLEICFTIDWLRDQFLHDDAAKVQQLIADTSVKPWLPQAVSIADYTIAEEVIERLFNGPVEKIYLRSHILLLVSDLVRQYFTNEQVNNLPHNRYLAELPKVEKYLVASLRGKLPDLEEVAKKFSLSQSTLKRQFKAIYGQNIYEYYLQKKMELARHLIADSKMNISEIAYTLGYEKIGSFSTAFKKHFGKNPASYSKDQKKSDDL